MSLKLLKPIINEPALKIKLANKNILCIADLHLGYEITLIERGINLPSQHSFLLKKILNLIKTGVDEIIIVGDVKHNIPLNTIIEAVSVPDFLNKITEQVNIKIIPGNHDTGLKALLPKQINLESSRGILLENKLKIGFIHGHRIPDPLLLKSDFLIMAHTHPAVKFIDKLFNVFIEPVWILNTIKAQDLVRLYPKNLHVEYEKDKEIKIIVLPAFNPLISGSPINLTDKKPFLGPLLKPPLIKVKESEIYMLDGTYLGKLSDLKRLEHYPI
ncbi:MAG: metallophosphoesterase [Candidatus Odinarchaeia archaeon]